MITDFFSKELVIRRGVVIFLVVLNGIFSAGEVRPLKGQHQTEPIREIINQSPVHNSFWSVVVSDSSGNFLYRLNARKLIRPASNLKLVTSGMLLEILGPGYRFETPLFGIGRKVDHRWEGDLLIIGKGDPSISGTFYKDNKWHVFKQYKKALDSLGIHRIKGSIIGNDDYFSQKPYPEGWDWNDLSFYYAVEINALSFNGNTVDLDVHADGKVGDVPRISWFPYNTDFVHFVNEQVITPQYTEYDESYRRVLGTNTIILRSKLPQGYYEEEPLSIADPARYFVDTFTKYLEHNNIKVDSRPIVDHSPIKQDTATYRLLHTHRSRALDSLIYQVNRKSSNFYTEMMVRTAAARHFDTQGSTESGLKLIRNFAANMGIDTTRMHISDGSGMSGSTLISSLDLTRYLLNMQKHRYFPAFYNSLAVAGKNGTFDYRFTDSPIKGNLRGKSGYVSGVRTLSGYLRTASGQKLVVSMATNHYTTKTKTVDQVHEQILEYLYKKY